MAKAFEKGLPSARVVWLAHEDHYIPEMQRQMQEVMQKYKSEKKP